MEDKHIHNVYVNLGASNHAQEERSDLDFYATPPLAVRHLLEKESFSNNVWEPAYGMGHIGKTLESNGYKVRKSDLKDYNGEGVEIIDFLSCNERFDGDIVSNPPYKHAKEFVEKALDLVNKGSKVAMFLKIQFLEGKKRYDLFRKYPPKKVYVAVNRYGCSKDGVFNEKDNIGSAICYCWSIWEKGFNGNPEIFWINE